MDGLSATVTRQFDGVSVPLRLKSLNVGWSLDSPAADMSCSFVPTRWTEELSDVQVRHNGELIFEGTPDVLKTTVSRNGLTADLDARSKGAKLLDNEALPCTMYSLSVSALFNSIIKPYGFLLVDPSPKSPVAEFTVRKGLSEWDAFCALTYITHGLVPYVNGDQVVLDYARSIGPIEIGTPQRPILKVENRLSYYNVISSIAQRDSTGNYLQVVTNHAAVGRGISRRRYLVPQSDLAPIPVADAGKRIRKSTLDMEETVVTMPGVWRFGLGQQITITHPLVTKYNLLVSGLSINMDEGGVTTRLSLCSSVYYYPTT